jgi:hypothetical protein
MHYTFPARSNSVAPISGKVTAATVAASFSTLVFSTVAPHIFHGQVSPDLQGLVESAVAAAVTFSAGYLARHGVAVQTVASDAMAVAKAVPVPVVKAVEHEVEHVAPFLAPPAPVVAQPVVAQPIPTPTPMVAN